MLQKWPHPFKCFAIIRVNNKNRQVQCRHIDSYYAMPNRGTWCFDYSRNLSTPDENGQTFQTFCTLNHFKDLNYNLWSNSPSVLASCSLLFSKRNKSGCLKIFFMCYLFFLYKIVENLNIEHFIFHNFFLYFLGVDGEKN